VIAPWIARPKITFTITPAVAQPLVDGSKPLSAGSINMIPGIQARKLKPI
jgi:hypothetical protein